jgi:squalene cyclase
VNELKRVCGSSSIAEAISRAESFLVNAQAKDGRWTDFLSPQAGESTQWVTGYIGGVLSLRRPGPPSVKRAAEWLAGTELKGGGWGYKADFLPDADSTANALLFLARYESRPEALSERHAPILLSFWDEKTGGFSTFRPLPFPLGLVYMSELSVWCRAEVSVSAMAGLALQAIAPRRYGDILQAVRNFLLEAREEAGFWESCWWDGRIYGTWISCAFLAQHGEAEGVERSARWLCSQTTDDGGWGDCYGAPADPFNTALALSVFFLSEQASDYSPVIQKGLEWLLNAQDKDGGWAGSARVREPEPSNHRPWEPEKRRSTVIVFDRNRLFTTATVLRALLESESKLGG